MKVVKIPKTVELEVKVLKPDGSTPIEMKPYLFATFLHEALDAHPPLGKGYKMGKLSDEIHEAVDRIGGKKTFKFENHHHKVISEALENFDFPPKYNRRVTTYHEAITNATDEKKPNPKPKKGKKD